jgi:hypothetical protein
MKRGAAVSIVTYDGKNAIDCCEWPFKDHFEDAATFVMMNLDEDQTQRLQLLDEQSNVLVEVDAKDEDAVVAQIRRWRRAARKE